MVAGCDPALPLLATPLSLLDPPVAFAWWPCGSGAALRLARQGLVHAAGIARPGRRRTASGQALSPTGATQVGFTAWREGLVLRRELRPASPGSARSPSTGCGSSTASPGAEARRLLDAERQRIGLAPEDLAGYDTQAAGHLQVASAVAAGLADAGVASEPAARAYGLAFVPLAEERFSLVIPAEHTASREVQALLKVLSSPVAAGPAGQPPRLRRDHLRRPRSPERRELGEVPEGGPGRRPRRAQPGGDVDHRALLVVGHVQAVAVHRHLRDVRELAVQQGGVHVDRDHHRVAAGGGPQNQKLFAPLYTCGSPKDAPYRSTAPASP